MRTLSTALLLLSTVCAHSALGQRTIRTQPLILGCHFTMPAPAAAGSVAFYRTIRLTLANPTTTNLSGVTVKLIPLFSSMEDSVDAGCPAFTFAVGTAHDALPLTPVTSNTSTVQQGPFTINGLDAVATKFALVFVGSGGPTNGTNGLPCIHRPRGSVLLEITIPSDQGALTGHIRATTGGGPAGEVYNHGQTHNNPIEMDILGGRAF